MVQLLGHDDVVTSSSCVSQFLVGKTKFSKHAQFSVRKLAAKHETKFTATHSHSFHFSTYCASPATVLPIATFLLLFYLLCYSSYCVTDCNISVTFLHFVMYCNTPVMLQLVFYLNLQLLQKSFYQNRTVAFMKRCIQRIEWLF